MSKTRYIFLFVLILSFILFQNQHTVNAANHCVDPTGAGGCFLHIQTAVDNANDGDTVRVVSGTYDENIVITKDITLLGGFDDTTLTDRTPRNSIIDGGRRNSVVQITSGANVTLDGFTITGGDASSNDGLGGGIRLVRATAIIHDNLIEDNIASSDQSIGGAGGGVYIENTTQPVTLSDNTVRNNRAYDAVVTDVETAVSLGFGGGIGVWLDSEVVASNNEIVDNVAAQAGAVEVRFGAGGGISAGGPTTTLTLENNTLENNTANNSGGEATGGGAYLSNVGTIVLENNIVAHNVASVGGTFVNGGGVFAFPQTSLTMTNNVIRDNVANMSGADGQGGGVYLRTSDTGTAQTLTLTGNEIVGNTAVVNATGTNLFASGGGIRIWGDGADDETVTLEDNIIRDNVVVETAVVAGEGDLRAFFNGGGINAEHISNLHLTNNDISNNTVVQEYTATGHGEWIGDIGGGGIYLINNSTIQIETNTISRNVVASKENLTDIAPGSGGGGIFLGNNATAHIVANEIADNLVVQNSTLTSSVGNGYFTAGGGIVFGCWDLPICDYQVIDNHIHHNASVENMTLAGNAEGGGGGGGIQVHSNTQVIIHGNRFNDNAGHRHEGGWGAAVSANEATVQLSANLFIDNGFSSQAGVGAPPIQVDNSVLTSTNDILAGNFDGLFGWNGSLLTVVNDTLIDNGPTGIAVGSNSHATVTNSIIVEHAETGLFQLDEDSSTTSNYNLLRNPENYQGGVVAGANDLQDVDPFFVHAPGGNLQLRPGSPAIDAGDNSVAPDVDFLGKKRPFDGDFNGTAQVDIGAYELGHTVYLPSIKRD